MKSPSLARQEQAPKYNQFGAIDDLTYLKRAGRVSASSAFFGNLFGVKPIVISDIKGHNYAYKKVKGRKASLIDIAQETVAATEDIEHATIWIGHIDDPEGAEFVRQEILKLAKPAATSMSARSARSSAARPALAP
jgi:fatty acid-binding protein DegV